MPLSLIRGKRKRAKRVDPPSPTALPAPVPAEVFTQSHHSPSPDPTPISDPHTIFTPSPVRRALASDNEYQCDGVEELDDDYYEDYVYDEPETPPSPPRDVDFEPGDEDLLARLLRREREYTRLHVYYEELHRRYADSKDQIAHLNRQVDVLAGRLERKEQRIRFLKLLVGRK